MSELTHFDSAGAAHMVDVSAKSITHRIAEAGGFIAMQPKTLEKIEAGTHAKGDVLGIARIAGIMAAKKTSDLIPLCHPLSLSRVTLSLEPDRVGGGVRCRARVEVEAKTGVEMEALNAVQVALLTVYDMCKAMDRGMVIRDVRLLEKSGGRSGHWHSADSEQSG